MQAAFNNIVQHLFHQPSLHSVTVDELENMAEQHPYFAAAHFLLLKKMQDTSHAGFSEQLLKTTLYFNNPLWLQYLLQPESAGNFKVLEKSPFIVNDNKPLPSDNSAEVSYHEPEIAAATNNNSISPQEESPVVASAGIMDVITAVFTEEETPFASETVVPGNAPEANQEENIDASIIAVQDSHQPEDLQTDAFKEVEKNPSRPDYESIIEQIRQASKTENTATKEQQVPFVAPGEKQPEEPGIVNETPQFFAKTSNEVADSTINLPTEKPVEEVVISFAALFVYNIPNIEEKPEEDSPASIPMVEQTKPEQVIVEAVSPVLFAYNIPNIEEKQQTVETAALMIEQTTQVHVDEQTLSPVLFEYHIPGVETAQHGEALTATTNKSEGESISLLGQQLSSIKNIIETPAAKEDVLFEPFHTIDYFASQGIKLSKLDSNPKDKLGKQLKSFTEWLKSMKKLPQVSIDKLLSENDESKVVADAIHSIENKEVITEAMAEVFEKQGLFDRAAGVYHKLSLLNPDKSAYFAAKIDALKQN